MVSGYPLPASQGQRKMRFMGQQSLVTDMSEIGKFEKG